MNSSVCHLRCGKVLTSQDKQLGLRQRSRCAERARSDREPLRRVPCKAACKAASIPDASCSSAFRLRSPAGTQGRPASHSALKLQCQTEAPLKTLLAVHMCSSSMTLPLTVWAPLLLKSSELRVLITMAACRVLPRTRLPRQCTAPVQAVGHLPEAVQPPVISDLEPKDGGNNSTPGSATRYRTRSEWQALAAVRAGDLQLHQTAGSSVLQGTIVCDPVCTLHIVGDDRKVCSCCVYSHLSNLEGSIDCADHAGTCACPYRVVYSRITLDSSCS